jgi:hypothetical protein
MPGFPNALDAQFFDISGLRSPDQLMSFNGANDAVASGTLETVWPEGGVYAFPSSEVSMTISSDNAADANPSGSGLRTVLVNGLNAGYQQISEVVALNGTSGVTLVNSYLRIQSLVGLSAGSGGSNAGLVYVGTGTITLGKPATVYNMIEVGYNLSHSGIITVPDGYDAFVMGGIFSAENNKTSEFNIFTRQVGGIFLSVADFFAESSPVVLNRIIPFRRIPSKTDVDIRCQGVGATTLARTFITLGLVRNE